MSAVGDGESLESLEFDAETQQLLGLDDVEGMLAASNGDGSANVADGASRVAESESAAGTDADEREE